MYLVLGIKGVMMSDESKRKRLILPVAMLCLAGLVLVIPILCDTSESPKRENAGRVLKLQEVQRIEDAQADYYFKSPRDIQVAPDGSLYVVDEDQFLKFGADGRFIKNLYKKGQGPGELEGISDFIITDDTLVVLQGQPNKVMLMSHDGEFIREFRPEAIVSRLCAVHDGRFVIARYGPPKLDKVGDEAKIIDVNWHLGFVSDNQSVDELEIQFPTRWFAKRIAGGRALIASHIAEFLAEPYKDKYLVICHAEDYRLRLFDLDRKQIVKDIDRDYRRVRFKQDKDGRVEIRPEVFRFAPPVKYLNDVQQLFIRGDDIWVMTSTIERGKGVLIDVFNEEGEYVDHFYLPLQQSVIAEALEDLPITFQGDYVYMVEYDEDDIPTTVKYRIKQKKKHSQRNCQVG
ncbi:MAG: 6-bladed beta-propeller [Candidatus Aminicenantes bacterium]|nr:MAG: 6-bladed beta-propeller [Candidatus Aminicenantes bacterium]